MVNAVDVKLIKVAMVVNCGAKYLQASRVVPKDVHPLLVPSRMVQQKTTVERSAMDNMTAVMI